MTDRNNKHKNMRQKYSIKKQKAYSTNRLHSKGLFSVLSIVTPLSSDDDSLHFHSMYGLYDIKKIYVLFQKNKPANFNEGSKE